MLQAKELRIGNAFQTKGGEIRTVDLKQLQRVQRMPQLYKPIEVTKDILVKLDVLFGFNHLGSNYEIEFLGCYHLRLSFDVGMSKYIGEIKYVHQLQNLYFALTGKELIFKTE